MNAPSLHILNASGRKPAASFLDAEPGPALLWLLLAAILAVRIVALAVSNAELFFDEAQYWAWGQEPAFGYYTKPPLIAWIIGATTSLCGDTPFCVRLPSPLMHFATSLVIHAIAAKLYSRRIAFWAALLYAILPGTSLSATLMSTDVPLLLLWSLGMLAIVHHVERPVARRRCRARRGDRPRPQRQIRDDLPAALLCGLRRRLAEGACDAEASRHLGRAGDRRPADRTEPRLERPAISSRPSSTPATTPTGTAGSRTCSACSPSSARRSAIIGPVPFAAFALAGGRAGRRPSTATGGVCCWPCRCRSSLLIAAQALISKANGNWAATGFPAAAVLAAAAMVVLRMAARHDLHARAFGGAAVRHLLCRLAGRQDNGLADRRRTRQDGRLGRFRRPWCAASPTPTG